MFQGSGWLLNQTSELQQLTYKSTVDLLASWSQAIGVISVGGRVPGIYSLTALMDANIKPQGFDLISAYSSLTEPAAVLALAAW